MASIITNPRERTRFFRFAIVGVIGAVVDFGVMNLLVTLFATPFVLAGTISFIAAIASNFTWNRYWTYPDSRSKPILRQLTTFSLISILGLCIRIPTLAILEPRIFHLITSLFDSYDISLISAQTVAHNLTLAIAVVIVMFWNFFVNRYWTYNDIQ